MKSVCEFRETVADDGTALREHSVGPVAVWAALAVAAVCLGGVALWIVIVLGIAAMLAHAWPLALAAAAWLVWWRTGRDPFWWLAGGCLMASAAWEASADCAARLARLWLRRARFHWRRLTA